MDKDKLCYFHLQEPCSYTYCAETCRNRWHVRRGVGRGYMVGEDGAHIPGPPGLPRVWLCSECWARSYGRGRA